MKKHMFEANGEAESLEDSPFRSASLLNIIGLACVWNLDPTESLNLFFGIDVIRTDSALLAVAFLTTAALSRCMDSWIQRTRVAFALCVCGLAGGALNVLSHMTLQLGALSMACAVASCVSIATFQCYFMLSNIVRISRLGMMRSLFSLAFWQALIGMSVLFDTFFSRTATLLALLLFGIIQIWQRYFCAVEKAPIARRNFRWLPIAQLLRQCPGVYSLRSCSCSFQYTHFARCFQMK